MEEPTGSHTASTRPAQHPLATRRHPAILARSVNRFAMPDARHPGSLRALAAAGCAYEADSSARGFQSLYLLC